MIIASTNLDVQSLAAWVACNLMEPPNIGCNIDSEGYPPTSRRVPWFDVTENIVYSTDALACVSISILGGCFLEFLVSALLLLDGLDVQGIIHCRVLWQIEIALLSWEVCETLRHFPVIC